MQLHNTTGVVLAPGTVSVLEAGKFIGQAQFVPMLPGDEQLVPHGEDSTVSVIRTRPSSMQTTVTSKRTQISTHMSQQNRGVIFQGTKNDRALQNVAKDLSSRKSINL